MTLHVAEISHKADVPLEVSDLLRDLPKQIVPIADLRPSFSPRQRGRTPRTFACSSRPAAATTRFSCIVPPCG
ncbi:hypothetical protein [Thermocatellispora tengchongensis]|uniref:hypothetical protein n=1 Tax=Thermocatellispora tengchongensis TaxID=1073253 RepID=UPI00363B1135